jgi:hypothetical protein
MRRAYSSLGESAAPYARPISWSVSHSSGNLKFCFSANFLFASTVSKLAPTICVFFEA